MSSYRRLPLTEESYITSVYLIIEGGNGVPCEPKPSIQMFKIVRLAGCTIGSGERAVFFRHSPKKNHRAKVEGTLWFEKKGKPRERWNRDKSAVRATRGACSPSPVPSGCAFSSWPFGFLFAEDKSIARHILIRGTSIMPLKTDNGTYSVKLLRAISLPPRRKSRSLPLSRPAPSYAGRTTHFLNCSSIKIHSN